MGRARTHEAQAREEGFGGGSRDVSTARWLSTAAQQCFTIRQVVR